MKRQAFGGLGKHQTTHFTGQSTLDISKNLGETYDIVHYQLGGILTKILSSPSPQKHPVVTSTLKSKHHFAQQLYKCCFIFFVKTMCVKRISDNLMVGEDPMLMSNFWKGVDIIHCKI